MIRHVQYMPKGKFPIATSFAFGMVAHNCHGKTKTSRQKQKHHGKTKNLTAKTKYLAAKTKTSRQNQMLHSKSKIALIGFAVGIGFGHEVFAWFLLCIWFCREVFGFVVKVVGHRTVCTWKPIIGENTRSLFPLQFYKDDLKQFGVQALLFRPVSDHSFHGSERFCKLTPMKNWPSSRKAGLSAVFEDVLPHRLPVKFGGSLLY